MVSGDPVAQAVQNHLPHDGVVAVDRVAAAAEIVVLPLRRQQVVDVVVKALEREEGPLFVALRRVVEHHVQVHLDTVLLECLDQTFQLVALPVVLRSGGIAGVGGEEADGVVPPVVVQLLAVHHPVILHLVKLEDGHQLHGVDPQLQEVGQLLQKPREGAGILDAGGGVSGKAPDVELVDDKVLHGDQGRTGVLPVKVVLHHPGPVVLAVGRGLSPPALPGHRLGIGVQQVTAFVENQPPFRLIGTVHPVGVLKLLDVQLKHDHGVHIADAVALGKGQRREGLRLPPAKQQQLNRAGIVGVHREVHAAGDGGGPVDLVKPRTDLKSADHVHGDQVDGPGQHQLLLHPCRLFVHPVSSILPIYRP